MSRNLFSFPTSYDIGILRKTVGYVSSCNINFSPAASLVCFMLILVPL